MDYLNQYWLTSHTLAGALHFTCATVGLVLGLGILFLVPGSRIHRLCGYIFIPTLLTVNLTAVFIHELGMRFGPFHYLIPFSLVFLFIGVRPLIAKMEWKQKMRNHIVGMVGASLGLWSALCAEVVVRTPVLSQFLFSSGGDSFWTVTLAGAIFVFIFAFIITLVIRKQMKRLGL